jgi:hypothetical protein
MLNESVSTQDLTHGMISMSLQIGNREGFQLATLAHVTVTSFRRDEISMTTEPSGVRPSMRFTKSLALLLTLYTETQPR